MRNREMTQLKGQNYCKNRTLRQILFTAGTRGALDIKPCNEGQMSTGPI